MRKLKIKRWFIPQLLLDKITNPNKKGISLYNKNNFKTYLFKNSTKHPTRFGWIAERKTMPMYFSLVIEEIK